MKKHLFLLLLICAITLGANAQNSGYDPSVYCTGWHNPVSFTSTGGSANSSWEGLTGSKPATASSCTSGLPWTGTGTIVTASNLATTQSSQYCTEPTSSLNHLGTSDPHNRFVIKGRGTDAATGNRLTYTPAFYTAGSGTQYTLDSNYTSSIRLGNYCGNGEAEALRYQFDVTANNALMTVWYALSLQNGQHTNAENPEFVILVERRNPTTNQWERIGGNSLCYIQPSPTTSSQDLSVSGGYGFFVGSTGTHSGASYGCNVYLPWNKVIIPLFNYIYQTVRITIGAGDCSMTAHYAYAYIAGDCEPMSITSSGCSAGENDTVTVLTAPAGMSSYQWYKNKTTHVLTNDEASDLTNLELIPNATQRTYYARAIDFCVRAPQHPDAVNDTVTLPQTTIVCKTQSLMNLNEPSLLIDSYLNTTIGNSKPTIAVDTLLVDCDKRITLKDISFTSFYEDLTDMVDTNYTQWEFYNAPRPLRGETPFYTTTGRTATAQYAEAGAHSVKVKVASFKRLPNGEPSCWNMTTIPIRTMKRPTITCVYDSVICSGEEVLFTNTSSQVVDGRTYDRIPTNGTTWHITDNFGLDTTYTSFGANWAINLNETSNVVLTSYSPQIFWRHDYNLDGIAEPNYCYDSATFKVRVEHYPDLTVLGDTIVCEGQTSTVQVQSDVPNTRFKWCSRPDSAFVEFTGNTYQSTPTNNRTFYVMAATPNNCISWDSLSIRMVNPVLTVPVTKMCDGEYLYLYGTGASTYSWDAVPNDYSMLPSANGDTLRVSPTQNTTYTMIGHGTNGCNADGKTASIQVYHYPVMAFEMSPTFIDSEEPVVNFSDVSQYGVKSLWDFGNGNTSTERQLQKTFTSLTEDSIYISLTSYNELNCASDTGFYVPVSLFAVWFPTAFTPTLSTNRTFHLFTHNDLEYFSIYIYDRRGDLVFYSTDQNFEWDGKHNGRYCDQGSYVYVCNYRRPGTVDLVTRKGTVLMLQ